MKFRLMDLLACPYDKHFPLELYVIEKVRYERTFTFKSKPACELYCAFKGVKVEELKGSDPGCDECIKYEVKTGVLYCPECGRWWPIKDEIPIILPDNLRKKESDLKFLESVREKLPEKVVMGGKPWNLSQPSHE
ncbi:Trm112 family protein [Infirmifilum sp. SLHALR2]